MRPAKATLLVAILGSSMAFADGTVVNVALPIMQRDLGASADRAAWVIEAYALFLASLVLVGGALGDRFGRRRVFSIGVMIFAVASALCGLSPGMTPLIFARAAQGVGGALLVPGSLSLISAAYPEKERGAAIGTWSAWSAITSAVGPVIGGYVVAHASWRWLFFFNLPLAVGIVALARAGVVETHDDTAPPGTDWVSAALVTAGLGAIVYALLDPSKPYWLLGVGAIALASFVAWSARHAHPMVPLSLFRSRTFAGTNLLTLLLYAALGGAFFFVPFDLIQVQHYSPAAAGAVLLPFVVLVAGLSRYTGAFAARRGARLPLVVGPLIASASFLLLALPSQGGSYFTTFFPGIVLLGLGMAITIAPLTSAVMASVSEKHAGLASGVNNAVSRAAGLLAVAAFGVLLAARFDRALDAELASMSLSADAMAIVNAERSKLAGATLTDPALRSAFDAAYVAGFRAVMIAAAVLSALGALAALMTITSSARSARADGSAYDERPRPAP